MKAKVVMLALALCSCALLAPAAFAASGHKASTTDGYPTAENVPTSVAKGATKHKPAAARLKVSAASKQAVIGKGTLPFTGLDLAFLVGGGILLTGFGLGVRRVTRQPR